jgi:hypothetical protein
MEKEFFENALKQKRYQNSSNLSSLVTGDEKKATGSPNDKVPES